MENKEYIHSIRHSTSHIMAQAVLELFPEGKLAIGPATDDGFYYDFDLPRALTPQDLEKIEQRMREIVNENHKFIRSEVDKEEAKRIFKEKNQTYKLEIIDGITDEKVTFYTHGSFTDLCAGPHVNSTIECKHFKLLSIAGAYWKGDEKNPMLQRIYGTASDTKESLEAHLKLLEEAKRRDHRKLGKELDLFSIHEEIGGGLVHWHPKGAIIRNNIEKLWQDFHLKNGYQLVNTPHIASEKIYKISGHLENYSDLMYAPMDIEGFPYRVKPMNCPGHIMIYKTRLHSYKELPIRYAEMGTVYRFERSGVLHGLMRVRGFTIDDAHIFCMPGQLENEILTVFNISLNFLRTFGFNDFDIYLSTRPEKYVGNPENWEKATEALKTALQKSNVKFDIDEGGGAFYGPKIDLKVKDALNRAWQCTTIQFDFNLPERFDITYVGEDGLHHRPYMVHRALLGSLERFFGVLIEHYAGAFPVWLAPIQVVILPISEKFLDYAKELADIFRNNELRVAIDERNEKIQLKIRESEMQKIPYMLVVGEKERINKTVSVRSYFEGQLGNLTIEEFKEIILKEVKEKIIKEIKK